MGIVAGAVPIGSAVSPLRLHYAQQRRAVRDFNLLFEVPSTRFDSRETLLSKESSSR